ncbi:MAG: hypothetical protein ACRD29_25165 [Acidimicrobiales bacterium]
MTAGANEAIINTSFAGTGVFVGATAAGVIAPDQLGYLTAAVSIALFVVGCAAFLWAFALAVSRSRSEDVTIGGIYFLSGTAPRVVRFRLLLALGVQIVVALAAGVIRVYTPVAFASLVPVFGLGLAGLWGARHGTFPPRRPEPRPASHSAAERE